jgi:transposase InsO family protein
MQAVTTIGLDFAKSVFQIHGVDAAGNVIVRRQLKRRYVLPFFQKLPPCLVGIEACASSHQPRGCVHHSDRGSQYASDDYRAALELYELILPIGIK